jgi:hypothetical protein
MLNNPVDDNIDSKDHKTENYEKCIKIIEKALDDEPHSTDVIRFVKFSEMLITSNIDDKRLWLASEKSLYPKCIYTNTSDYFATFNILRTKERDVHYSP